MKKKTLTRILGLAALCCVSASPSRAQSLDKTPVPRDFYREGKALFVQKAYAASLTPLQAYLRQAADEPKSADALVRQAEAEYMLACAAYELGDPRAAELLRDYLATHPATPHANRVQALIASTCFFDGNYAAALDAFDGVRPELLSTTERDDMTYRLAVSHLQTGDLTQAAVWFETLRATSPRYEGDCTYYISYIRYTQGRLDEALPGFLGLQSHRKYQALVPYYIAEIYLAKQQYDKAEIVAQNYLSAYPGEAHVAEMLRVQGTARYHVADWHGAMTALEAYRDGTEGHMRRDAAYMLGMAYCHNGVYSQAPAALGEATLADDALAQNAYLHMGLAYLRLGDKNKARMAFEQAAASDADRAVKEQAAYNYALCIHETAYDAFGQSVTVFENFLNEFPRSAYAPKVSSYLVDVYMSTRSYEAALKSIERIRQPDPMIQKAKLRILFQLGTQAFANADFSTAIDYFTRAWEPAATFGTRGVMEQSDALYWRGESYYRLGRMAEAATDFERFLGIHATRKDETVALAHYNLGYIAFHQQAYGAAENRFAQYVRLETGENRAALADAYNRLGDCCLRGRRFDEAKRYYATAEKMGQPTGDYSYYQLALVAGLQKDYAGKVALLDRLAEKYPESSYAIDALYEKGRSYVQAEQNAQAIATFRQLLQAHPESPVSRKAAAEIGLLYYQDNDYDRAIEAYTYVVTRYPGSEEARLALHDLKSIYVEANRVSDYARLVEQLPGGIRIEAGEQDSLTYAAAERIYMKGDIVPAKESLTRYLQSYPDGAFSLGAHYNLCTIARQQGDEDGILLHAGKLLEYPDSPYTEEALLMRGEVLFNRKQYDAARVDYRQLQAKATTPERRRLGQTGDLRCSWLLQDHAATVAAATTLLAGSNLTPELRTEALYDRAKASIALTDWTAATPDLRALAEDTRTLQGAESKYLLAQHLYDTADYAAAEKEALDYIDQSTPHAYWLARTFILLSDVYAAQDKKLDARQYLLSLQQNYTEDDDIRPMIEERLEKLK